MRTAKTTTAILFLCTILNVSAQEKENRLFKDNKPLDIALKVSISQVKGNTNDTLYEAHVLYYKDGKDTYDSVKTEREYIVTDAHTIPDYQLTDQTGAIFNSTSQKDKFFEIADP